MAGQPQPGTNSWITFDVTDCSVHDPAGGLPTTVIQSNHPFHVHVDFEFAGMLANWLVGLGFSCQVSTRLESMGAGPEVNFGPVTVMTSAGNLNYAGTVSIPANLLQPGAYKLLCTVVVPGSPIAGYIEGPIVQLVDAQGTSIRGTWGYTMFQGSNTYDTGTLSSFAGTETSGTFTQTNHYGYAYQYAYSVNGNNVRFTRGPNETWIGKFVSPRKMEGTWESPNGSGPWTATKQ